MNPKTKKYKFFLFLCVAMMLFASCAKEKKPIATRDGTILTFKDIKALDDGYYVVKANGNIHPLLSEGINGAFDETIVWFTKYDKIIPIFEEGDQLIVVKSDPFEENEPSKFTKMRDVGWTIGAKFNVSLLREGETGQATKIRFSGEYCPYSPAAEAVAASMGRYDKEPLLDINGQEFTPNMLSPNGILQGLTKDAMYQFRYYVGTKYNTVNMKADTHVYEAENVFESKDYIKKQSTYFVVPIPEGIEKGFYVVNGYGMLYYNAGEFAT